MRLLTLNNFFNFFNNIYIGLFLYYIYTVIFIKH